MKAKMHHLATLTTPPKPAPRFDHSSRLSERKRALFPSQIPDSSDDSDIGHMSPLEYSSSPEQSPPPVNIDTLSSDLEPMNSDDSNDAIIGRFSPAFYNFQNQENIDPKVSPKKTSPKKSPKKQKSVTFDETEPKSPENCDTLLPGIQGMSPTEILKTPHDASNTNQKLPRLMRKSLIDITNIDSLKCKRKSESPIESPASKTLKTEHQSKTSKARTALFPESMFSVKSFYPKNEIKHAPILHIDLTQKPKLKSKKTAPVYLCNRTKKQPNKKQQNYGLINAGVRHKIKKPRHKPALTKTQLLKAALNIVKNSPLNEYLDDLDKQSVCSENECGVSFEQIQKMDSILKSIEKKPVIENFGVVSGSTDLNRKRCRSPPVNNDQPKKFFKSGHSHKATVTITNNIKFEMNHGELSLIEKKHRRPKREIIDYDPNEFTETSTNKMIDNSFTDILKTLENDEDTPPISTTPPMQHNQTISAHNSVIKSENQIQLHGVLSSVPQLDNSMLLSPTSLVCDLTSGLALDSPKNQPVQQQTTTVFDKLSTLKKRISFPENMDNTQKLFPIFYGKQNEAGKAPVPPKESKHVRNIRKIWKPLSEDQTLIDAGQKKFGLTQCPECKCVYSLGEPEDEIMHYQHHNSVSVLRYNCWKHERVVNHFANGKVIQINPNDPKSWLKKVKDVVDIVNRELGFVDVPFNMDNQKVFLCIMNKQIVGCLVAEPKTEANKMLPNDNTIDVCTEETYPIKCGVSRLWVAVTARNKGVGTCLMNAMRSNFMYGHILSINEIAFSAPTEAGKKFAAKYTKTNEFLIYTS